MCKLDRGMQQGKRRWGGGGGKREAWELEGGERKIEIEREKERERERERERKKEKREGWRETERD